ncbi:MULTISPECIES: hypothetical protein [unclassified Bradyrhizobium]|uniref:hypothetical protein n=1 Tax=unclassified Bradyrhizobium TaxID=2631580 RepID=UPI001FF9AFE4|nr:MULTISPECIES: hypothetical protein [unclassified Bradyrhizobium]
MKSNKEAKLSRTHVPVGLSPADWQRGLRRQFGREQSFVLENLGSEPFFSEFRVTNPNSEIELPRGGTRPGTRRELLLRPRLRNK